VVLKRDPLALLDEPAAGESAQSVRLRGADGHGKPATRAAPVALVLVVCRRPVVREIIQQLGLIVEPLQARRFSMRPRSASTIRRTHLLTKPGMTPILPSVVSGLALLSSVFSRKFMRAESWKEAFSVE